VSEQNAPRKVAIVGANLAGARAAEALRNLGYSGSLCLIGEEELRPYERPPLSKTALEDDSAVPQWVHAESFYRDNNIDLITGRAVTSMKVLAPRRFQLSLSDGTQQEADVVLLTTGGSPRRLSSDKDGIVHYIRQWEDAARLRPQLLEGRRVLVIGSGFIGAEVAATALGRGCQVSVIEAEPLLFPSIPSRIVANAMSELFSERGATLVVGRSVVGISAEAGGAVALLDDGSAIHADIIVAGIGIEPRVELARMVDAEVARGVLVGGDFQTTVAGLYAAGDVCTIAGKYGDGVHVEHWKAAQEQGVCAAHAILGKDIPPLSAAWCWSDQLGQRIEVAGTPRSTDQQVVREGADGELCVFHLRDGRLAGVVSLNSARTMRGAMKLLEKRAKPDVGQLADQGIPINRVACEE